MNPASLNVGNSELLTIRRDFHGNWWVVAFQGFSGNTEQEMTLKNPRVHFTTSLLTPIKLRYIGLISVSPVTFKTLLLDYLSHLDSKSCPDAFSPILFESVQIFKHDFVFRKRKSVFPPQLFDMLRCDNPPYRTDFIVIVGSTNITITYPALMVPLADE